MITGVQTVAESASQPRFVRYLYDKEYVYRDHIINAFGHVVTTLHHPALGVPILNILPNGVSTLIKSDGFGRVSQVVAQGTANVDVTYAPWADGNRRGMSVHTTAGDGSASSVIQDELGRTIRSSTLGFDGQWIASSNEYNAFGYVERASRPGVPDPSSSASEYTYDRLGRMTALKGSDGETTVYTHRMFTSNVVDPEGHEAYVSRDKDDRNIESGHMVDDAKYGEVSLEYGPFDQIETITDADDNITTMAYDVFGRRTRLVDPDSGTSTYKYNGFGERVSEVDAMDGTTTYEYDALGRLVSTISPDGASTFAWDNGANAVGSLVSATSPDGVVIEHTYDALGRLERTTRSIGGATYAIEREYDSDSRLRYLSYPEVSGRDRFRIAYDYNTRGFLRRVRDVSSCPTSKVGKVLPCPGSELWRVESRNVDLAWTTGTFGNGIDAARLYDDATGRMTDLRAPGAGFWHVYGYDSDGLVEIRTDMHTGRTHTYEYDDVHRLGTWKFHEGTGPVRRPVRGPNDPALGPAVATGYQVPTSLEICSRALVGSSSKPPTTRRESLTRSAGPASKGTSRTTPSGDRFPAADATWSSTRHSGFRVRFRRAPP